MAHVLDLLGCVAKGPTTDEALAAAPDAIRAYLRFLKRHGEPVDPDAEFKTKAIEHITEGQWWLGSGDTALVFQPDLNPLTPKDAEKYIRHLEWSRADVVRLVDGLTPAQLEADPKSKGRSIHAMLEHMLESEYFYLSSALGRIEGLPAAGAIARKREGDLLRWMSRVRQIEIERIRSLTPAERSQVVEHWKQTWTARKALRRMLEHEWEHLIELSDRLGQPI